MSGKQNNRPQTGKQTRDFYRPWQFFHLDSPFLFLLEEPERVPFFPAQNSSGYFSPPFLKGIQAIAAPFR